jgi:hypothetical protein
MSVIDVAARIRSWATDMVVAWFQTRPRSTRGVRVTSVGPDMNATDMNGWASTRAPGRDCLGPRSDPPELSRACSCGPALQVSGLTAHTRPAQRPSPAPSAPQPPIRSHRRSARRPSSLLRQCPSCQVSRRQRFASPLPSGTRRSPGSAEQLRTLAELPLNLRPSKSRPFRASPACRINVPRQRRPTPLRAADSAGRSWPVSVSSNPITVETAAPALRPGRVLQVLRSSAQCSTGRTGSPWSRTPTMVCSTPTSRSIGLLDLCSSCRRRGANTTLRRVDRWRPIRRTSRTPRRLRAVTCARPASTCAQRPGSLTPSTDTTIRSRTSRTSLLRRSDMRKARCRERPVH